MKKIKLTKGTSTIVDDDDFDELIKYKWCCNGSNYATRSKKMADGRWKMVYMHRELMGNPDGMEIDHINGNRLDNRKCNLRICSSRENMVHIIRKPMSNSGFFGVSKYKNSDKWVARIRTPYGRIYLGSFESPKQAAMAYDECSMKINGEFATLNFPPGCDK